MNLRGAVNVGSILAAPRATFNRRASMAVFTASCIEEVAHDKTRQRTAGKIRPEDIPFRARTPAGLTLPTGSRDDKGPEGLTPSRGKTSPAVKGGKDAGTLPPPRLAFISAGNMAADMMAGPVTGLPCRVTADAAFGMRPASLPADQTTRRHPSAACGCSACGQGLAATVAGLD